MGESLQLFSFEEQDLRIVLVDGEPWWVAADVCQVLEIADTEVAIRRLDDDEKLTRVVYGSGQNRKMWCVNESGVYHLVFTSRKESAKRFRRWVTDEVIPSIRKTGSYSIGQPSAIPFNKDVQQRCIANESLLPAGYWCVVNEMYKEALIVVAFQKELKDWALPDGSCGRKWREYCTDTDVDVSASFKHPLWVPNLKRPTGVWIYPYDLLDTFRSWLRIEYADYYEHEYSVSRLGDIDAHNRRQLY